MAISLQYLVTGASADSTGAGSAFGAFDTTSSAWTSGTAGFPHWVQATLDQPVKLTSYILTPNTTGTAPKDWVMAGSNDGSSWSTVDTVTAAASAVAPTTYTVDTPGFYSFYRLTASAGYGTAVGIQEIALVGDLSIPRLLVDTNLTPHITASSATSTTGGAVANLFDGDTTTSWTSGTLPASAQVTLDAPYTVYRYTVAPTSGGTSAPKNFTLEGSTNGTTWTTVDTRTNITAATNIFFVTSPGAYSYYRLTVTAAVSGTTTLIREWTLMDSTVTALSASSEFATDQAKRNLLDGDYTNQWATASGGLPAWAVLTLATPATLKRYRIVAQGGQNWDPKDWLIQGSNDNSTWTTLDTQSNVTFVASPWSTARPGFAVSGSTPYTYFRYYVTANHGHTTTNTRELEIFGISRRTVAAPPMTLKARMAQRQAVKAPPMTLTASTKNVWVGHPTVTVIAAPVVVLVKSSARKARGATAAPFVVFVDANGTDVRMIAAPPMAVTATVQPPQFISLWVSPQSPRPEDVIPLLRPVFMLELMATKGELGTAVVEYEFTTSENPPEDENAVWWRSVFDTVELLGGTTLSSAVADVDLPAGEWLLWHARITYHGVTGEFSDVIGFQVDPDAGSFVTDLTWTVTAGPTDSYLWFVDPASGAPDDQVTVIGDGFDMTPNRIDLAGTEMPIVSWDLVPATDNAATDLRTIDSINMIIDPEHHEVVVTVPDVEDPGGPLTVQGS